MNTKEIISDEKIERCLEECGFHDYEIDDGRLVLLELISKASAGYKNSYTEENFLNSFGLLKNDRTPNKHGRKFIMSMVYASSNRKPFCFGAMQEFRS